MLMGIEVKPNARSRMRDLQVSLALSLSRALSLLPCLFSLSLFLSPPPPLPPPKAWTRNLHQKLLQELSVQKVVTLKRKPKN